MKKKNEKQSIAKPSNSKHITTTTTMKTTITTKTKIPVELLQNMDAERPYSANFVKNNKKYYIFSFFTSLK